MFKEELNKIAKSMTVLQEESKNREEESYLIQARQLIRGIKDKAKELASKGEFVTNGDLRTIKIAYTDHFVVKETHEDAVFKSIFGERTIYEINPKIIHHLKALAVEEGIKIIDFGLSYNKNNKPQKSSRELVFKTLSSGWYGYDSFKLYIDCTIDF